MIWAVFQEPAPFEMDVLNALGSCLILSIHVFVKAEQYIAFEDRLTGSPALDFHQSASARHFDNKRLAIAPAGAIKVVRFSSVSAMRRLAMRETKSFLFLCVFLFVERRSGVQTVIFPSCLCPNLMRFFQ